ncbi:MAG TPA: RHS repeat-associated core domain-containing protein [Arachidicoccus soli]|nr:RHS repeat-associated core domain-containing protein [Arachidicoccus soli]
MNNIVLQYRYLYENNCKINYGNITSDQFRGITGITYNISNLPEQLTAGGSLIKYWYDNNGNRFRKQEGATDEIYVLGKDGETEAVFDANGSIKFFNILSGYETIGRFAPTPVDLYLSNTTLNGSYEAQNSITVENNVTVGGLTVLKAGNSIHLKSGFTAPNGTDFTAQIGTVSGTPKRYYYLKDHLGSIRVVVDENGDIVSSDDYDPWGMTLTGRSTNIAYLNAKYKFTGKERDTETGYDYFGARYYDGRIGKWMQVDPLSEKYFEISPYTYARNNPLVLIDPKGTDDYYYTQDGQARVVEYSWWHNLWNPDKYFYEGSEKAPINFEGRNYYEVEQRIGEFLKENKKFNLYENNIDINSYVKAKLSEGQFPLNISEVLEKSGQNQAWDTKRTLDPSGIYLLENKGYLADYVGNAIWGGIMANAGYYKNISFAGAGARQVYDALRGVSPIYFNLKGFFDDPRDTEAIEYGYRRATIWFKR